MTQLMVHHKVRDYAAWRPAFDDNEATRTAAGLTRCQVFQCPDDPNDVVVISDVADRSRACDCLNSDDMRFVMQAAGVIGEPDVSFVE